MLSGLIPLLIEEIQNSGIDQGLIISSVMKLKKVICSIAKENIDAAINQMTAFKVEAQVQSEKKISARLAELWLETAERIIQALKQRRLQ